MRVQYNPEFIREFATQTRGKAPEVWAYMAGILDGEGTVSIQRSDVSRLSTERRVTPKYQIKLQVTTTCLELMEWIQAQFGGSLNPQRPRKANHSMAWRWEITDYRVGTILRYCLPYMIVKREHAKIGIEYIDGLVDGRKFNRVPDEEMARRRALYLRMLELPGRHHPQRASEDAPDSVPAEG